MKSIIEFITDKSVALLNEKQNFLVKGHTISQQEKIVTDKNIKALDKAFT